MSGRLTDLEPWLYPWAAYLYRYAQGYGLQLTSVRRSYLEQWQLYSNYLRGYSKYPALPPGTSRHEQGRAFDMIGPNSYLRAFGRIWESWGGTYGGDDDPIHFEA